MKIALHQYEENGYHDSDFMLATFDTETETFSAIETSSTRYAGGMSKEELDVYIPRKNLSPNDLLNLNQKIHNATLKVINATSNIIPGDEVEVVKGRKYTIGLKTTVLELTSTTYRNHTTYYATTPEGTINLTNLKMISHNPKDNLIAAVKSQLTQYGKIKYPYIWKSL